MPPLYGWIFIAWRLQSYFEETVYFLPLRPQKFVVVIWLTLKKWKTESTLESPSSFERIQHFNH